MKECCGTCKYHIKDENFEEDYICLNTESDYLADWTDYNFVCDEYKERGAE